jgi:hypothetical protein
VELTTVATVLEGSYRLTPTVPRHRPVDLLMVATAPTATVRLSLIVILAAEAVTAGAPTTGLAGEPGRRRPRRPRPREQPRLRRFTRWLRRTPKNRRTTTQKVLHDKRQWRLPRFLCTASQSTSGEIQTSGDHQVRREERSSTVAQMLCHLHRKCWWQ